MSHLRYLCANCAQPKPEDKLHEPYCQGCLDAVEEVRKLAEAQQWGKALFDVAKHEALRGRSQPLGMGAKLDPRSLTDRFDTTALRARLG